LTSLRAARPLATVFTLVAAVATIFTLIAARDAAAATPAKVGPPNSMDALGDSITRGFHAGSGLTCFPIVLTDCPARSWSTGTDTAVNSLYLRIRAINPTINGRNFNDAVTGAKVADLLGAGKQVANAVARSPKPELVTILIGANDVCASSEAAMTTVADFRSRIDQALAQLSAGLPDARVQIASIPDIYRLWQIGKDSSSARSAWSSFSICQAMLANPTSTDATNEARRQRVRQRNIDFNTQLQQSCAQYLRCRYDNNAAFNTQFVLSDMSTVDFFHPNTAGQAKAALTEWNAGFSYADTTAPVTTIAPTRGADGADGWYKDDVPVTLSATDAAGVSGSEYFYKLQGAADKPWTRYTGPFTISDEGTTEVDARSVDVNGNVEASKTSFVKIDKHAPSFTLTCPAAPVGLNTAASYTVSNATDGLSGLAENPNGTFALDTSVPGTNPNEVEIQDRAGNTATHNCDYDVRYPTPGAPTLDSGTNPNSGEFGLSWTGSADTGIYPIRYTLQHEDSDDAGFSEVASGLSAAGYSFGSGSKESEGTWRYRVKGVDGSLETDWSGLSDTIKVDRSAPRKPTLSADRAPDYAGGGGWFKDTVTVSFADNGDPDLADGSAGTGVDPATVPAPVTKTTSGTHALSGKVSDRVGNQSDAGTLSVQVDATAPSLTVSCPARVVLGGSASATVAASDAASGLSLDPSGTVAVGTSSVGPKTVTATARDNVGHAVTKSCTVQVEYGFSGLLQPVNADGSSVFKLGSTVPVKFKLADSAGTPIATAVATLTTAKVANSIEGTEVEAVSTSAASTGNQFRYDATSQQYVFNLNTKALTAGTWSLKVTLDDGATYSTHISLVK
jgi:lysophospholipase L1-like esterase